MYHCFDNLRVVFFLTTAATHDIVYVVIIFIIIIRNIIIIIATAPSIAGNSATVIYHLAFTSRKSMLSYRITLEINILLLLLDVYSAYDVCGVRISELW